MKRAYLESLIESAPTAWALIRASEAEILQSVRFKPPIVEIGCGDGLFTKVLFAETTTVNLGIDRDKSKIHEASQTGIYTRMLVADAISLPLKEQSFATIFLNGVLEHIPRLSDVLQELKRVLKKNGRLIFTCPTSQLTVNLLGVALLNALGFSSAATAYGNLFNRVFKHCNLFDEQGWKSTLQQHGWRLVSCTHYNPKWTNRAHELLLPFAIPWKLISKPFRSPLLKWARQTLYLSWIIPLLCRLPSADSTGKLQSSIAIIAKKV